MRQVAWILAGLVSVAAATRLVSPPRPPLPGGDAFAQRLQASGRVILITLDGPVRDDVMRGPLMRELQRSVASDGVMFEASTASVLAGSLTGYQAMLVGALTSCRSNECGRVRLETVGERLAQRLQLPREDVVVFASWALLRDAVSRDDGPVFIDAPPRGKDERTSIPWVDARFDDETFARAEAAWQQHHPRFLHLAFLDTDQWAHLDRRAEYERALADTDVRIQKVLGWVRALPPEEAEVTTVIVTADHGRGHRRWTEHGFFRRGSREIFIAAIGPLVHGGRQRRADQTDVRPTIERLFGLCPQQFTGEGRALDAIVGELPCLP